MKYIAHRINTVEQLKAVPTRYGVELDLRDDLSGRVYIQHNPFEDGEDFETYLKYYRHSTMILNVKSERIELKILEMLQKEKIEDFFFLDSSFPMIHLLSQKGESRCALRVSEYEGLDTPKAMAGKVQWIWVDCFSQLSLNRNQALQLKSEGYRLCLVSPELQGQPEKIESYRRQIEEEQISIDAVCTKLHNMKLWEK